MLVSTRNYSGNIIGLAGNAAVGKDTLALALETEGFYHISLSDYVRAHMIREGIPINRKNQNLTANRMRKTRGGDYWISQALGNVSPGEDLVLSGVYAPVEAITIESRLSGLLVAIGGVATDNVKERYQRVQARADGFRDELSFEEFEEAFLRENSGVDLDEANVGVVVEMAHIHFDDLLGPVALRAATSLIMSKVNGDG